MMGRCGDKIMAWNENESENENEDEKVSQVFVYPFLMSVFSSSSSP